MEMRTIPKDVPTQEAALPNPVEDLATQVAAILASNWRRGHCCTADELFINYPRLRDVPEQAIRVIYEEICQRQLAGHSPSLDEYEARYPQWREEIALLLEVHRTLEVPVRPSQFPERGDTLGEYRLLSELGSGALGKVYLAEHPFLAGRLVIIKVTPREGQEHLTLARLQHSYIVPIYGASDFVDLNIRQIVMPCLGGAALHQILHHIRKTPVPERKGIDLLNAIPRCSTDQRLVWKGRGGSWEYLMRASFADAIAWIGMCLAEGLQYAHERGMVHLDLKPSNILLTADGVPMLLDFHLAREPVIPGRPISGSVGGTPGYMPTEQIATMRAIRWSNPIVLPVDARADIFGLGRCLAEALGATFPVHPDMLREETAERLKQVPPGLREILVHCLENDAKDRYQKASDLVEDIRRHLTNQPLKFAANHGLKHRWTKWRRRHPYAVLILFAVFAAIAELGAFGHRLYSQWEQHETEARHLLDRGHEQFLRGDYHPAVETLTAGISHADQGPGHEDVGTKLRERLRQANRAELATNLHAFTEQARFRYGDEHLPDPTRQRLVDQCREAWSAREQLLDTTVELPSVLEHQICNDLLDIAILWADSHTRLNAESRESIQDAMAMLTEAQTIFGTSAALWHQQQSMRSKLGEKPEPAESAPAPKTAWERFILARFLVLHEQIEAAEQQLDAAIADDPRAFWPWFWKGLCAYRQKRYDDAASAFTVCTALAPSSGECYFNRALAWAAAGKNSRAIADCEKALQLQPSLTPAQQLLVRLQSRV